MMAEERLLGRFSRALDCYPPAFAGNRLNLLFVEEAEPIADARSYLRRLDELSLLEERREYLLHPDEPWPFPTISLEARPDPWLVSEALFERYDIAHRVLPVQSRIGATIDGMVCRDRPDAVALVIVDGLSYFDLPPERPADPWLADGLTDTSHGFRRVLGQPSISRRLFALGYVNQLGFTYYADGNELSDEVHAGFSEPQIVRVSAFEQVLDRLSHAELRHSYSQITLAGLDHLSHSHRDRPQTQGYIDRVLRCFDELVVCLRSRVDRALVVLTADHGILWRDALEGRLQIADDLFREDVHSPRHVKGPLLRPYGRVIRSLGQSFTMLGVPWMTRHLRGNEWGVHGGISAWESVIPLLIRRA